MLPTTLTAVLIFIALLGPGYLYIRRIEVLEAFYKVSPFRETVAVIVSSLCCNSVALAGFTLVRVLFPELTPDVGAMLRGEPYFATYYALVISSAVWTYAGALLVAFLASHPLIRKSRFLQSARLQSLVGEPVLDSGSAWTRAFGTGDDTVVRAAIELSDGSWIDGWLYGWNAQPEEDADRAVTLYGPMRVRPKRSEEVAPLVGIRFSVVSASAVVRIDVTHVDSAFQDEFNRIYTLPASSESDENEPVE